MTAAGLLYGRRRTHSASSELLVMAEAAPCGIWSSAGVIEASGMLTAEQAQAAAREEAHEAACEAHEAAWEAAREEAREAAREGAAEAAWAAAASAAWEAHEAAWEARNAARDAAIACALREHDAISEENFRTIVAPWRTVLGDAP